VNTTMPAPTHLLERAYQLINANQLQNAELVLDAVVRVDPQNVEAWKTYLLILQSQNDLDWLKERLLKTRELSETDKTKLINYHLYLTNHLNGTETTDNRTERFTFPVREEREEMTTTGESNSQFELIDVFDYPVKAVKKENRARPRRRAIYNPFALDGILNAMSHDAFGKKVVTHILEITALAKDFARNPKGAYARFSKSPYFEKYAEVALLALFVLSVRLVISNNLSGYIFLGVFVIGGRWWLVNFGNRGSVPLSSQTRIYQHENKSGLPVIKDIESDQAQKNDKENTDKTLK
jgi:hypothetical protein